MARFIFLLLLVANLAFAGHIYLTSTHPREGVGVEVNREAMRVLSITDSASAQREALEAKKLVEAMTTASCLQLTVKPADAPRAQTALGAMELGERLGMKNVEEFTRFAVALPAQRDRKTADALVASLKKANVKDVLIMADNTVSLGLFSTEDAAKRVVAEMETKAASLVKGITVTPKNPQTKETVFTIRAPDAMVIGKVALMQREFDASVLKGAECPEQAITTGVASVVGAPVSDGKAVNGKAVNAKAVDAKAVPTSPSIPSPLSGAQSNPTNPKR
ncbi:MAG: hypothetical protein H7232_15330 [Aeromicrobium sp.]|nr:hypothetical protein [Burkholderiales bacterium]